MKNIVGFKLLYIVSCLLFINIIIAKVNPKPGENLWRLTARIADCVDGADTKLNVLDSQQDFICSKIEKVDDDLATHNDVVCSKLENITSLVENIEIGSMNDNIVALCSKIEKVDDDLATHNDVVCSKLESISSKIDELELVGACERLIFQSDIPFVINKPGVYCLAESITFGIDIDIAITIASDNVLLDLQDKKIDGSAGGSVGIAINSGCKNVTIQNGILCNMNDKGIDADATKNISFVSMSVSDSLIDSVVDMPSRIAPITCLQIKDVKVADVGRFKEFSDISVVDSVMDNIVGSIVDLPDCITSPITGININCVVELLLDNCHVFRCLGDGFALQATEHALIKSCRALQNGGNGFALNNTDTTRFKWSEATNNCLNGFCDSAPNADNLYNNCVAKQNGVNGFSINGGGKALQECVASQNNQNGFNLVSTLLADASLDTAFGTNGIVTTPNTTTANAIALQKDGKIVAIGSSGGDVIIARYNSDGTLDTTFGINGLVITNFGPGDSARDVAIQEDGKIVVAGLSNGVPLVARYTVNGDLDLTFGNGGSVLVGIGIVVQSLALQQDGKIVVVGSVSTPIGFGLIRLNRDGSLDLSFGIGGAVITDLGGTNAQGLDVAIQKNGKIVVVGTSDRDGDEDFAVARYNIDGSLDVSFNPFGSLPGVVTTDFPGLGTSDVGNAVAIQKDGKIVVAGTTSIGPASDFAVARYNIDGSLDATFNPAGPLPGTVTTDFLIGIDIANAVAIQKDGKIVVAGQAGLTDFALARYKVNGVLDATFNPGVLPGTVTTIVGGVGNAFGVAIQKDGKIIAGGVGGLGSDFTLVRYNVFKQGVAAINCLAEENGINGFLLSGTAYLVKDSSAINNTEDGILLTPLTIGCQLLNNEVLQNKNIGIENLGGPINQILSSRAFGNTLNYFGVVLVTIPILSTGFWANVEG